MEKQMRELHAGPEVCSSIVLASDGDSPLACPAYCREETLTPKLYIEEGKLPI